MNPINSPIPDKIQPHSVKEHTILQWLWVWFPTGLLSVLAIKQLPWWVVILGGRAPARGGHRVTRQDTSCRSDGFGSGGTPTWACECVLRLRTRAEILRESRAGPVVGSQSGKQEGGLRSYCVDAKTSRDWGRCQGRYRTSCGLQHLLVNKNHKPYRFYIYSTSNHSTITDSFDGPWPLWIIFLTNEICTMVHFVRHFVSSRKN